MASWDSQTDQPDSEICLQRTKRTRHIPGLALKYGHAPDCKTLHPPRQPLSANSGSENGDYLYMTKPRQRDRNNRSLSIISNHSDSIQGGNYDGHDAGDSNVFDHAVERSPRNIINREIHEWQHACRTSHPYCWFPEAKYDHLNTDRTTVAYEPGARIWVGQTVTPSRDEYKFRRRAVSDGLLTDPSFVADMAHMVAIKLLSSCFTLPPGPGRASSSQNNGMSERSRSASLGDLHSPMISSLKMHNHYRYSRFFGQQRRNTSPEHISPDPHARYARTPPLTPLEASMHTADISTPDNLMKRQKVHRALHVTERSATNCSLDCHTDEYLKSCTSIKSNTSSRASRFQHLFSENAKSEDCPIPADPAGERHVGRETSMDARHRGRIIYSDTFHGRPQTKYDLKLGNRSEPHHDFMQPVKDIVSKRWNNLRRRLGSSIHSNAPGSEFGEVSAAPGFRTSSPATTKNGKERRRRARASGDISSYESTPHYNSPVSSHFSPAGSEAGDPHLTDFGTNPAINIPTGPLSAALSLALESDIGDEVPRQAPPAFNAHRTPEAGGRRQPSNSLDEDTRGSIHSRETDHQGGQNTSPSVTPGASSSGRCRSRQRRKSMLSEVFTAQDLNDDEETAVDPTNAEAAVPNRDDQESGSQVLQNDSSDSPSRRAIGAPSLLRTSTSGTQVFTPSDERIEIDGLSVGLRRHAWDGHGKKRERSYL